MGLYYTAHGNIDAPLLVFLHGGGVSSWMWAKQIEYFSNYHCVTIDLPEQGRSSHAEHFSIESSAKEVYALIQKLTNGKKVIVIGFSLGAQVAIQMLSMKPDFFHQAIINSALVKPNALVQKLIRPAVKMSYPFIKNRTFSKLQAKALYVDENNFETYYKESSEMKSSTLIRILKENMSFEIPLHFDEVQTKMLVTVGEKEKTMMKKSAADLVSNNSNCTGIIIPDVGHGVSLVNPTYFNKMIENWIEESTLPVSVKRIQ